MKTYNNEHAKGAKCSHTIVIFCHHKDSAKKNVEEKDPTSRSTDDESTHGKEPHRTGPGKVASPGPSIDHKASASIALEDEPLDDPKDKPKDDIESNVDDHIKPAGRPNGSLKCTKGDKGAIPTEDFLKTYCVAAPRLLTNCGK